MSKDGNKSFLGRLHFNKKTPVSVTVQRPEASEASQALINTAQSHAKKKRGGGRLSSLFGLKPNSKTKKPTAGDSADAAAVKANTSREQSAPSGDGPQAATGGPDATSGNALGALAAGKDGDVAGREADAAGTTPVEDLDPWSRAYAELKRHDSTKDLVETCEKILTHRANPDNAADAEIPLDTSNHFHSLTEAESVEKLSVILQPVLDKYRKETWWGKAAEGADMVISKIGKGVGDALQACQPAAFAWSAICLVVPAVVQSSKEQRKVADGLEYVVERMNWFIWLTKAVMRKDWPDGHPFRDYRASTEIEVVNLFKAMLQYEMECACRAYDTKAVVRLAGDLLQLGNWDAKLDRIKTLDSRISKNIQQYQLSEVALSSSQIADNIEDLLFEIRQIKLYTDGRMFKANKELNKLIARFGSTTYLDQMRLNPDRHRGTCKWFCRHDKYKDWLRSPECDLLLVTAEPGCGKSVLSRYLVEEDLPARRSPESRKEPIVCYFFFKDNDIQRSLVNCLGAVLHQLLSECKDVAKDFADSIHALSDEMLQGPEVLWNLFENASNHDAFKERTIYCLFDALDECSETGRRKLVTLLRGCVEKKRRIRFLITGRPNPDIVQAFRQWSKEPVRLEGEGDDQKKELEEEIDIVFRHKVQELAKSKDLSEPVKELLEQKLLPKGEGQRTYLWVRLVFELIEKETPQNLLAWAALLERLPVGVSGAYDQLLSKVDKESKSSVSTLLHIIYIASRPLTLTEANIAVQVRGKYDAKSIQSLGIDDKSFRVWLKRECGFFITEYEGRLFFIHQTAREFLSGSKTTKPDAINPEKEPGSSGAVATPAKQVAETWENSIKSDEEANLVMSECCIANILVTFQHLEIQPAATAVENGDVSRDINSNAFLDYCAKNWGFHFRKAHISNNAAIAHLALRICDPHSTTYRAWFGIYCQSPRMSNPEHSTSLLVASRFGHNAVVTLSLDKGADTEAKDEVGGRTPLSWAAENGYEAVVQLLLDKGADTEAKDMDGRTPLLWAAMDGYEGVVQLLLDKGADIEAKDEKGWTPLLWAAVTEHEAGVQLLLDKGADTEAKDEDGQTPLIRAAKVRYNKAVIQLLLDKGADTEAKDKDGRTPLARAAERGHEAFVQLLLDKGDARGGRAAPTKTRP